MEILIGILLVLILLIVADGARRMLRDRGSRLRLRIDPAVSQHKNESVPESNPELLGGPRVVKKPPAGTPEREDSPERENSPEREDSPERRDSPKLKKAPGHTAERRAQDTPGRRPPLERNSHGRVQQSATTARTQPPSQRVSRDVDDRHSQPETDDAPPLVMEKEEPPMPAVEQAEQHDLFGGASAAPESPADGEILDVIVIHLVASRDAPFPGRELLQRVLEQGMRFGEMNIFHRHSQGDGPPNLQFSMANALEPGYFDVDEMDTQQFRAVTFFMKLPGPLQPLSALERMLTTARKLHDALGGEMRDDQHSVLTPQTIEHLRQKVQEFERRQRLTHAH